MGYHSSTSMRVYVFEFDLGEEDFVGVGSVDVGGVKEGDAGVDCMANELYHVGLRLQRPVDCESHGHASESLRRHF